MEREDTLHFPLDKVKIEGIKVVERLMLVTNAAEFFPVSGEVDNYSWRDILTL